MFLSITNTINTNINSFETAKLNFQTRASCLPGVSQLEVNGTSLSEQDPKETQQTGLLPLSPSAISRSIAGPFALSQPKALLEQMLMM